LSEATSSAWRLELLSSRITKKRVLELLAEVPSKVKGSDTYDPKMRKDLLIEKLRAFRARFWDGDYAPQATVQHVRSHCVLTRSEVNEWLRSFPVVPPSGGW
jgi:hypothetical protein